MKIEKREKDNELVFLLSGRLDVLSSPELASEIEIIPEKITKLVFDFENLEYVSSAGLRTILLAYHLMNGRGTFIVKNPRPNIMELFKLTKFSNILSIE